MKITKYRSNVKKIKIKKKIKKIKKKKKINKKTKNVISKLDKLGFGSSFDFRSEKDCLSNLQKEINDMKTIALMKGLNRGGGGGGSSNIDLLKEYNPWNNDNSLKSLKDKQETLTKENTELQNTIKNLEIKISESETKLIVSENQFNELLEKIKNNNAKILDFVKNVDNFVLFLTSFFSSTIPEDPYIVGERGKTITSEDVIGGNVNDFQLIHPTGIRRHQDDPNEYVKGIVYDESNLGKYIIGFDALPTNIQEETIKLEKENIKDVKEFLQGRITYFYNESKNLKQMLTYE